MSSSTQGLLLFPCTSLSLLIFIFYLNCHGNKVPATTAPVAPHHWFQREEVREEGQWACLKNLLLSRRKLIPRKPLKWTSCKSLAGPGPRGHPWLQGVGEQVSGSGEWECHLAWPNDALPRLGLIAACTKFWFLRQRRRWEYCHGCGRKSLCF